MPILYDPKGSVFMIGDSEPKALLLGFNKLFDDLVQLLSA